MPVKTKRLKRKIKKALSPEEMTKLSNIQSLLDELVQMGGEAPMMEEEPMVEEEPIMEEEIPMTEEDSMEDTMQEREVKMILKGLETTSSEGATASDDAEERMEEPMTDPSDENLSDVEKTLMKALIALSKGKVKKAKKQDPVIQVLNKLADIQKANKSQMDELSEAFGHVLKGLGVLDQLEVTKSAQPKERQVSKAINNELLQVLKSLQGTAEQKTEPETGSQGNQVRKNLGNANVLAGLVGPIPGQRTW